MANAVQERMPSVSFVNVEEHGLPMTVEPFWDYVPGRKVTVVGIKNFEVGKSKRPAKIIYLAESDPSLGICKTSGITREPETVVVSPKELTDQLLNYI